MNITRLLSLCLALGSCSNSGVGESEEASAAPVAASFDGPGLTVVELFQSQGCSSCPPANANLNAIADQPGVLALSFAVTYWDYLGWKDRFARPEFTQRQWDYAKAGGRGNVYTPQVIVDGRVVGVGSNPTQFAAMLKQAGPVRGGPAIERTGDDVVIAAQPGAKPARVLLVRYDPRSRNVPIRAGENGGRTLPHRNIVTELRELGAWTGARAKFAAVVPDDGLSSAILIQQGKGGPIVAARKI